MQPQQPKPVFANDVDYWKTGQSRTVAQWTELTLSQLRQHGAKDIVHASGESDGRHAFMFEFTLAGERFKIVWPVLPLPGHMRKPDNERAAQVQAITTLYHDVKARCVAAGRYGAPFGFFQFLKLPDGRTLQQCSLPELTAGLPEVMRGAPRLPAPE